MTSFNPPASADVYTAEEVAALFRVSKATIHRMINDGTLRATRFGRAVRIPASVVRELLHIPGGHAGDD